jgi:predicted methyltransferase
MKNISLFLVSFILISCSQTKHNSEITVLPATLTDATQSSSRADENVERDEFQHPKETLEFFGIRPNMTVVEISPGAGYYTEILAPFLAREGQYVMAVPRMPSNPPPFLIENEKKLQNILISHQDIQTKTRIIPFEAISKRNKIKPAFADMVLTFNSVHNWVAVKSTTMAFKLFYDLLKKGGVLGVVQHRIAPEKKNISMSGYMTEKEVIALATRAGFKFAGKSEINANPKDTADYPEGVWTLPPVYRLGKKDKDKYEDIGESDRMTLKFLKP